MIGLSRHEAWMEQALCATELWPDAWYSERERKGESDTSEESNETVLEAQRVCRRCPVIRECRIAGQYEEFGIWGGVTSRKRAPERRKPPAVKHVDATGSIRRIKALATLGWAPKDVSTDIRHYTGLKVSPRRVDQIRAGAEPKIPKELADAIERAYKHLKSQVNPSNSSSATSTHARLAGWAEPRRWRGLDVDDPEVSPGEPLQ